MKKEHKGALFFQIPEKEHKGRKEHSLGALVTQGPVNKPPVHKSKPMFTRAQMPNAERSYNCTTNKSK